MAETILREKQRSGQNTKRGRTYSRLATRHRSHAHAFAEHIRSFNVSDAELGARTTIKVMSKNFVQDMWLELEMKESSTGNYAPCIGQRVIQTIKLKISGRTFTEYSYDDVCFLAGVKMENEEKRAQFEKFHGPLSAQANPGKVIVPIYTYWSTLLDDNLVHQKPWINPAGASVLEIEIQFSTLAQCSGSSDGGITNCQFCYTELMLPQALENQFKGGDREVARIDYNSLKNITLAAGVNKLDLSSLHSSGPIRTITFYEHAPGTADSLPLLSVCAVPSKVAWRLNGREVFDESYSQLDYQQFLGGAHQHVNCKPFQISFCQDPMSTDSSGFLPSSNSVLQVDYTGGTGNVLEVIVELEKIFRKDGVTGRITRSDS